MRVHITLDEKDIRRLDKRVGARRRSRFIATAVGQALDDEECWEMIESAIGALPGDGHDWDHDPAAWVHDQRRAAPRHAR